MNRNHATPFTFNVHPMRCNATVQIVNLYGKWNKSELDDLGFYGLNPHFVYALVIGNSKNESSERP